MNEQYISIWELVLLQLFMGSITYLIGSVVFFFTLRKRPLINTYKKIKLLVFQLCVSIILSLVIWQFWPLGIDIMYGVINIPAIFSELITILLILMILGKPLKQ